MFELFDDLRTCADVRALGVQGIGEGPRLDYKERLELTDRGTLTQRTKKELARDVAALANAQGGLLVIGVKDPGREGGPPAPEDFVGITAEEVPETLGRDIENSLLSSISPPLYPQIRLTEDDFEYPEEEGGRRFVVIGVSQSRRLHQVTAGGDYRFYRWAGYQNKLMDAEEVRLRLAAESSAGAATDQLLTLLAASTRALPWK